MKACNTEELYLLHRKRLLSLIQSKVSDKQQAEDLLHDSFEKLENCCAEGCECERPKSYLFRMALNTVFDFFTKNKKARSRDAQLLLLQEQDQAPALNQEEACDLFDCISKFLHDFTPENREAFLLVDVQQKAQIDVAKELGIPLSTLKSRVQRTRKYLKQKLETCCPDFEQKCI